MTPKQSLEPAVAEAFERTQPLVGLGDLSERFAKAAGKSLDDLTDQDRAILQNIEAYQQSQHVYMGVGR